MKKCCFIIPYFGKFPNYFPLFLKSCWYNPDFNWLVITDDKTDYEYPPNVSKVDMSFSELKAKIQEKFDFPIKLSTPYKLCDYKPAYGYIFSEFLSDFQAWGHCDTDTILGHLGDFITDRTLKLYDKIFCLGHMVVYKNSEENNKVFMSEYKGRYLYKESFTTDKITVFDEEGTSNGFNVNQIFLEKGKRVYEVDHSLNINKQRFFFRRTVYKGDCEMVNRCGYEAEPYRNAVYLWENGYIHRFYFYDGKLIKSNHPYIHLQGRKMIYDNVLTNLSVVKIIPNRFSALEVHNVTMDNFYKIRKFDRSFSSYWLVFKEMFWDFKRFILKR